MNPLVSVIIPAFNAEWTIGRAVRSVNAQGYKPLQIILIEDGGGNLWKSADLEGLYFEYFNTYDHIGPAAVRNHGICVSKGEFIAFLDADDEYLQDRIVKCVMPMIDDPAIGATFCRAIKVRNGHAEIRNLESEKQKEFPAILWPSGLWCTPGTTVRRSVLEEVREENGQYFDESLRSLEDRDLWIRIQEVTTVKEIKEPLVVVHEQKTSAAIQWLRSRK